MLYNIIIYVNFRDAAAAGVTWPLPAHRLTVSLIKQICKYFLEQMMFAFMTYINGKNLYKLVMKLLVTKSNDYHNTSVRLLL